MDNTEKLTESEIHELALIYAQEKFSKYLTGKSIADEENKELKTLIDFYKNAKLVIPSAEITEFT